MSDREYPEGFTVEKTLADIIYRIQPDEARLIAGAARIGAKQVLDELAASDPQFAAERRRHDREMRTWRRERNKLGKEIVRLETPVFVTALTGEGSESDAAAALLRATKWLFDNDAPGDLILDLLRTRTRDNVGAEP